MLGILPQESANHYGKGGKVEQKSPFISISDILERYRITKPTFYAIFRRNPEFPKPYMVGRIPRYRLSEIEAFEVTLQKM